VQKIEKQEVTLSEKSTNLINIIHKRLEEYIEAVTYAVTVLKNK